MSYSKEQDKVMYIIGLITLGIFLAAGIFFYVNGSLLKSLMPPCMFYKITGYYCPGCGGTRAVYALFQGKFLTSLFYQPFILYTAVVGGWFMVSQTIERCSRGKIHIGMHFRPIWAYIGIGIIFLNCIVKNLFILVADVHLI